MALAFHTWKLVGATWCPRRAENSYRLEASVAKTGAGLTVNQTSIVWIASTALSSFVPSCERPTTVMTALEMPGVNWDVLNSILIALCSPVLVPEDGVNLSQSALLLAE
jgi:hypothetical protein